MSQIAMNSLFSLSSFSLVAQAALLFLLLGTGLSVSGHLLYRGILSYEWMTKYGSVGSWCWMVTWRAALFVGACVVVYYILWTILVFPTLKF